MMTGSGHDTPAIPAWLLRAIIIGWASFGVAAVATMLFFAAFDPAELARTATFPFELSRFAGYTLGFFLLWSLTVAASVISLFLLRSLELHPRPADNNTDSQE
jgi:hypothetical protein